MKNLVTLVGVLAVIGMCTVAKADNSSAAAELVQALNEAGYPSDPPTPAGESLRADEVSCFNGTPNSAPQCTILKNRVLRQVEGPAAMEIIEALLSMDAGLDIRDLDCFIDTLPRPTEAYDPEWSCNFQS